MAARVDAAFVEGVPAVSWIGNNTAKLKLTRDEDPASPAGQYWQLPAALPAHREAVLCASVLAPFSRAL